ncbi:MAG: formylglycine-generating enzyme family protein [Verrucomicrobiota bacterium]
MLVDLSAEPSQRFYRAVDDPGPAAPAGFVWIPPGTFLRGSPSTELWRNQDETPHEVVLTQGFFMGRHEVTQSEYQAVMTNNPSFFKGPDLPVESLTWVQATNFCARWAERERAAGRLPAGWECRLPTEAQWEYACQSGATTAFPFGNSEISLAEYAWYQASSQSKTHAAGQLKPNAFGLYDMLGNVWEWCDDFKIDGYYAQAPQYDPSGPTIGSVRVLRGGSWDGHAAFCRPAARLGFAPSFRGSNVGFRLALGFVGVPDEPGKEKK